MIQKSRFIEQPSIEIVGEGLRALPPENVYIFRICEANNNIIAHGNCDLQGKSPGGDRAPPLQRLFEIGR